MADGERRPDGQRAEDLELAERQLEAAIRALRRLRQWASPDDVEIPEGVWELEREAPEFLDSRGGARR
jgi:hypothetical protein